MKLFQKMPHNTDDIVRLEDIKIPPEFTRFLPSREKIIKKAQHYKKHKVLENPITVVCKINEKGKPNKLILVDGYISYLILLFCGQEYAPIIYKYIENWTNLK